jgi:hypothetical protein
MSLKRIRKLLDNAMFVLMIYLVHIHCFCELNLNDNFLMKYWFRTTPIGQNWLRLIMNTLTFDFLDLKKRSYSIRLAIILELFKWKKHLCLENTRWKSQITKILSPMAN